MLHTGRNLDQLWPELPERDPSLPSAMVDRPSAIRLATAIKVGTPATGFDLGIISISMLDLALSALSLLAAATGVPRTRWCEEWALGVAAGKGGDPE